jgi:hypothetical protein
MNSMQHTVIAERDIATRCLAEPSTTSWGSVVRSGGASLAHPSASHRNIVNSIESASGARWRLVLGGCVAAPVERAYRLRTCILRVASAATDGIREIVFVSQRRLTRPRR